MAHTRHGKRGFGHVGGQHNMASGVGRENFLLVGVPQARVERQHLGLGQLRATQKISRFENFALTRQKNQNVAARLKVKFMNHPEQGLIQFALLPLLRWAVAKLDRVIASRYIHQRRTRKKILIALGLDRGRGQDQFQLRPALQQFPQVSQQQVDVDRTLVDFINDDGVVGQQLPIVINLLQKNAVGHHLHAGCGAQYLLEASLKPNALPDRGTGFLRQPAGDCPRRQPSRLGQADAAQQAASQIHAELGQLG